MTTSTAEQQYHQASEAYHRLTSRASVEGWAPPTFDAFHARLEAYSSGLDTMHAAYAPLLGGLG
jgi:hypothetical protein